MHPPKAAIDKRSHTLVTVLELLQIVDLQLHRVPILAHSVLDLRIVERPAVRLETTRGALVEESFQNFCWSNFVRKNAGQKHIDIVHILAPITITWNQLEQGTLLLCHKAPGSKSR